MTAAQRPADGPSQTLTDRGPLLADVSRQPRLAGLVLAGGLGLFWLVYQLVLHAGGGVVDGTWQAAQAPAPSGTCRPIRWGAPQEVAHA